MLSCACDECTGEVYCRLPHFSTERKVCIFTFFSVRESTDVRKTWCYRFEAFDVCGVFDSVRATVRVRVVVAQRVHRCIGRVVIEFPV